jgi:hypothetical protein
VNSEGKPINVENRFKTDGNEYPYESPWGKGTIIIKQTDPYHWTQVVKLEGGNTVTAKVMISKDGKRPELEPPQARTRRARRSTPSLRLNASNRWKAKRCKPVTSGASAANTEPWVKCHAFPASE